MAIEIAGALNGSETVATAAHGIVVPAGSAAGNMLVVQFITDGSGTPSADGFVRTTWSSFTTVYQHIMTKILTGAEADFDMALSTSRKSSHRVFLITGNHATTAPEAFWNSGNGGTVTSPALTLAGWGAPEETLFMGMIGWDGGMTAVGYPAGLPDNRATYNGAGSSLGLGVATANLAEDSDGANIFVASGSDQWVGATLGIRPAAAAAAGGAGFNSYPAGYSPSWSPSRAPTAIR